jgi:hypothetical protein
MELRDGLDFQFSAQLVINVSSADSESRLLREMLEAPLKIIWREGQVAIELHQKFPVITLARIISIVKRFHHTAAGLPEASVLSVDDSNPWVLSGISIEYGTRLVGRAVIDDDPFFRQYRLTNYTIDGSLDMLLLVTHRCDNYVSRHFA